MLRRKQGDIGEASAIAWLAQQGALIFTPLFRSPDYDLIAEIDGDLVRIEVKTSISRTPVGNWAVAVCTRGGNQSWNKITSASIRIAASSSSSMLEMAAAGSSRRQASKARRRWWSEGGNTASSRWNPARRSQSRRNRGGLLESPRRSSGGCPSG